MLPKFLLTLPLVIVSALTLSLASASDAPGAAPKMSVRVIAPLIAHGDTPTQSGPALNESGSKGCSRGRPTGADPGSTLVRELTSGGTKRTYRVHVGSAAIALHQPVPLVLLFHGRGGTGALVESYSGMLPVSDREGFLLVSPDGIGTPTSGWGAGASPADWPVDDVQFGRDLLAAVKSDFCINPAKVFAAGHSNGAFMAARLACAAGGEVKAVAPVAGISVPAEGCAQRLPVLAFHGTADDVVPYAGGKVRDTFDYPGAENQISAWARNNGCAPKAAVEPLATHARIERFSGCAAAVSMILADGAGHDWPSGEITTADLIWSFFKTVAA